MTTDIELHNEDCLAVMSRMASDSVDLVLTDPPYFRVKDHDWDRQWASEAAYLSWIGSLCDEWRRVLRPNGSLYVFASPKMAWGVEGEIRKRFNVLQRITWRKQEGIHWRQSEEALRNWFPQTENIIFAEHFGADSIAKGEAGYEAKCDELRGFVFEPLRAYFDDERKRCGITTNEIMEGMAARGMGRYMFARHTFTRSQWQLPTREQYEAARELFNSRGNREYLRRDYEDLRREYEDLRRPFNVTASMPYTDVWDFPAVPAFEGKHPCAKPLCMMEHIIEASSRPGAVVLDCFAGSGVVGLAARRLGRRAILSEADPRWARGIQQMMSQKMLSFLDTSGQLDSVMGR